MPKKKEPQFMITYLCSKCGIDFARHDREKPVCFYCGNNKGHKVLSKQELTPEVISERIKLTSNRMYENLKKAYEVMPEEISENPEQEKQMIELLARAKKLRDKMHKLMTKEEKRSKKDH